MAIMTFPNVGECKILDQLIGFFEAVEIHLFCTDLDIGCDDITGDYDYCDIADFQNASFVAAVTDADGRAFIELDTPFIDFPCTGSATVYGIVGVSDGSVIFAGKFDTPIAVTSISHIHITELDIKLWDPFCPPFC